MHNHLKIAWKLAALLTTSALALPGCEDSAAPKAAGGSNTADAGALGGADSLGRGNPGTDTVSGTLPDAGDADVPVAPVDASPDGQPDAGAETTADTGPDTAADTTGDVEPGNQTPKLVINSPKEGAVAVLGQPATVDAAIEDDGPAPWHVQVWVVLPAGQTLVADEEVTVPALHAEFPAALPGPSGPSLNLQITVTDAKGATVTQKASYLLHSPPAAPVVSVQALAGPAGVVLACAVTCPTAQATGGEPACTLSWSHDGLPATVTTAEVPAGTAKKGEVWTCTASAADDLSQGPSASASATVANTAPVAGSVVVAPKFLDLLTEVTCTVGTAATDADGDAVAVAAWHWSADGVELPGAGSQTLQLWTVTGLASGASLSCSAVFSDGTAEVSATANPATVQEADVCAAWSPCDANATCSNTATVAVACACKPGYTGGGKTCADVDECQTSNGGCSAQATCTNTPGAHTCACKPGYTGDGKTCADIDECATSNGGCSANAVCTNLPAGAAPTCACKPGFAGDGKTCADIDECELPWVYKPDLSGQAGTLPAGWTSFSTHQNVRWQLDGKGGLVFQDLAKGNYLTVEGAQGYVTFPKYLYSNQDQVLLSFDVVHDVDVDPSVDALEVQVDMGDGNWTVAGKEVLVASKQKLSYSFDLSELGGQAKSAVLAFDTVGLSAIPHAGPRITNIALNTASPCPAVAVCANQPGSFACACQAPYSQVGDSCSAAACGDAKLDLGEECDAGPQGSAQCQNCQIVPGNICKGSPSNCGPLFAQSLTTGVSLLQQAAGIVAGDWNKDGVPDTAIAAPGFNAVMSLLGAAAGSFAAPAMSSVGGARRLVSGDLNGDAQPDLVVAGSDGLSVLLGKSGGFLAPSAGPAGSTPGVRLAQVVGTAALDLIVATNGGLALYPGTGTGGFGTVSNLGGQVMGCNKFPTAETELPEPVDLNGDGTLDLLAICNQGVVAWMSLPSGAYATEPVLLLPSIEGTTTVAVSGLFGADKTPDLLTFTGSWLQAVITTGTKTKVLDVNLWCDYAQRTPVVADFDVDGHADVAFGVAEGMVILFGTGLDNQPFRKNEVFLQPFGAGYGVAALTVTDWNGDGLPDLILASSGQQGLGYIRVMIHAPLPVGPAT